MIENLNTRQIPGWPYVISNDGRVFRLRCGTWREVKQTLRKGYWCVALYDKPRSLKVGVHRLVLMAFVGTPLPNQVARHLNGKPLDNRLENLAWGTQQENSDDAIRHGTKARGSRMGKAKLTDVLVVEIRRRFAAGESQGKLAREIGVSQVLVGLVVRKKIWKHVA